MTKSEAKQHIETARHAHEYLARVYGGEIDMRPWVENHPVSQAHWMLVQGRMDAKSTVSAMSEDAEGQRRGLKGIHTVENGQGGLFKTA